MKSLAVLFVLAVVVMTSEPASGAETFEQVWKRSLNDAASYYPDLKNPNSELAQRTRELFLAEFKKGDPAIGSYELRVCAREAHIAICHRMNGPAPRFAIETREVPPRNTPSPAPPVDPYTQLCNEGWQVACALFPVLTTNPSSLLLKEAKQRLQPSKDPAALLLAIEQAATSLNQKPQFNLASYEPRLAFLARAAAYAGNTRPTLKPSDSESADPNAPGAQFLRDRQ